VAERLVVIGGDAGGMTAATQARRLRPDLDIVALERGEHTSYSACGIPYLVGGEVGRVDELVARTPQQLREQHRIDVRLRHEAMAIDVDRREVEVRDHDHGRTFRVGFDHLMIGTGAAPRRPDIPGIDLPHVYGVQTLDDGARLLEAAERGSCHDVVVVGGGYIGLEIAEAFLHRGCTVAVVESGDEVLRTLDPDMGRMVSDAMRRHGIDVRTGAAVKEITETAVLAGAAEIPAAVASCSLSPVPTRSPSSCWPSERAVACSGPRSWARKGRRSASTSSRRCCTLVWTSRR
jgi:NADPH-dependent 2,4-dienoyl-CoA reductase/sulfur reductase-like enzyme